MTATRKPVLVVPDNGYFQVWERPCGHSVRVTTEDTQYARQTNPARRSTLDRQTRDRLASGQCRKCAAVAEWVAS